MQSDHARAGGAAAPVVAVVTTYSPPDDLPGRLVQLAEQVDEVVVVDDGSPGGVPGAGAALAAHGVHVIALPVNSGIATALNRGIAEVRRRHPHAWVLTLDQDSSLDPGYVEAALRRFTAAEAVGLRPAAVAAGAINDRPVPAEASTAGEVLAYDPIQSGLLVPTATFDAIGLFDETLFIDLVDTEFWLRARAAGMVVVAAPESRIRHRIGTPRPMRLGPVTVRVGGRQLDVPVQRPFRVYYMVRNTLVVGRRYARRFPRLVARRVAREAAQHAARLLWGPQRGALALAMASGVRDALRGRSGVIPARTRARLAGRRADDGAAPAGSGGQAAASA